MKEHSGPVSEDTVSVKPKAKTSLAITRPHKGNGPAPSTTPESHPGRDPLHSNDTHAHKAKSRRSA